jgi:(1->4)-alpha-D-glucan 1-alpha-D-glucosylmutase
MAIVQPPSLVEWDGPGKRPEGQLQSTAEETAQELFDAEMGALEAAPLRRPSATYRLQLHRGFRLDDVAAIVDYLASLGISDCYLSPHLDARPGSTHGYDIFDPGRINSEIGDDDSNERLVARLAERGMGRVIDVVPNHMGVGGSNHFWLDVLENGPQAESARYFDIDWDPVKNELKGRVLLPILEDFYGKVLEAGLLVPVRDGGSFWVRYRERMLPLSPRSYFHVLEQGASEFRARFDSDDDDVLEFLSIRDSIRVLPPPEARSPAEIDHVRREKEIIKRRLRVLCDESPRLREYIDGCVARLCGTKGAPESFDALHVVLEQQAYRLAYWRVASEEINYRRFFDVTDLAGLRVEDPEVFEQTHALIVRWVSEGGVTGLRIDHPDGLADPLGYFQRLQERLFLRSCEDRLRAQGREAEWPRIVGLVRALHKRAIADDPHSRLVRRFPIVAEKILSRGESLPANWPIDGTVGYEYLNALNGLFIDPNAADAIHAIYREFTGDQEPFDEVLRESKLLILEDLLASELNALTRLLNRAAERGRNTRDFTLNGLRGVVREVIACFRIYRTYLRFGEPVAQRDRDAVEQAVARARQRRGSIDESVFSFLNDVLVLNVPEGLPADTRAVWQKFVDRFQQTTGPVQAKGLEDTTFYRQVPLVSLNEVGGDPSRFGSSPGIFHALNEHRLAHWPGGLNPTSTHDTKRGEDTRIRIDALSELADEWRTRLVRWSRWNARKKVDVHGTLAPDARDEYYLYQTLIGAWPFDGSDDVPAPAFIERIQKAMVKAVREAKRNTSWTDPDPSYSDAICQFVAEILGGVDAQPFLRDFLPFQRKVARIGVVHSLAQTLLKLASPGIPDIYQGSELWDFRLVDPDNRTPVDYELRQNLMDRIRRDLDSGRPRAELARELLEHPEDGAIKLFVVASVLNHRRLDPALYSAGSYRVLDAQGEQRGHVVAFLRRHHRQSVVVVVPRLAAALMGEDASRTPLGREAWSDTEVLLPEQAAESRWCNLLTGETIAARPGGGRAAIDLAELFRVLPVAILAEDVATA